MIVYLITNKTNGKRYVGQTRKTLSQRLKAHQYASSQCRYLKAAFLKYGSHNFEAKVLSKCSSQKEMDHRESYYIRLFNTAAPTGYNLRIGGSKGAMSEETRRKIGESNRGIRRPKSPEHRAKIGLAHRGRKHSPDTVAKRAAALRGRKMSSEAVAKSAAWKRGRPRSEETKIKLSLASKRRTAPYIVPKMNEERKAWLSAYWTNRPNPNSRKSIIRVEDGKSWLNIKAASDELGYAESTLRAHLIGRKPHVGGMHFRYGPRPKEMAV